ncbi:MAG: PIG-L family deacetylase [Syntrophomonadaceae bacterium]
MQPLSVGLFIGAVLLSVLLAGLYFVRNTMPGKQFTRLPNAQEPAGGQKVLVLVPHPDDESLAIGGYIHLCRQNGAEVRLILVSDGNRQGLRDLRYQEFRAASQELGISEVDLRFWGYADGSLQLYQEAIEARLEQEIEQYRPDLIIYPHPYDKHKDHSALGRCAEQSLKHGIPYDVLPYAYLIHYNFFQLPAFFSNHLKPPRSIPGNHKWHKIVLSPEACRAKRSALLKYRSQRRNPFLLPLFRVSLRDNELLCLNQRAPHSCSSSL